MDLELARRLLAARKKKQAEDAQREAARQSISDFCAKLRAFYYAKQCAFFRSKRKRRATKKTRRSGATSGGCRELLARALETPKFRAVYITETRKQASARAWRNDTQTGMVDVIEQLGTRLEGGGVARYQLGGVIVSVRDGDLALVFDNGALIELFGADDEQAIMGLRGLAKHVYWIDEAQDFRWLERLYKAVITAGQSDFGGEVWLTGTPGVDLAGMFYNVTRDDGEQLKGWEVHHLTVQDNPFFGHVVWEDGQWFVEDNLYDTQGADQTTYTWDGWIDRVSAEHRRVSAGGAPAEHDPSSEHRWGPFRDEAEATARAIEVRWERGAGDSIRENAWDEDDPDLLREWYARWVKDGARFVYAVHSRTEHELCYAPMRYGEDGFPDIKLSLLDLPGWKDQRQYLLGVGADLGTTRAFGWSMVAWSLVDPILYEVASWKKAGLDYDEMAAVLRSVQGQARVGLWVADAGGGGKPAVKGWSRQWLERYQLPILEAQKPNKLLAQRQWNTDTRQGNYRMRTGSPLLAEMKVHRWLPTRNSEGKLMEDPATHRDLCFVAGTMIETETGLRPIESMKPGDRVWTRNGLRSVEAAWCSGVRPVWRLTSDAGVLVGTQDHPIWTNDGWKALSELTQHDMLTTWKSTDHQKSERSEDVDTVDTRNHKYSLRHAISSMARGVRSIARSGRIRMERSQQAITSITSMRIHPTTTSPTSHASLLGSISAPTCETLSASRSHASRLRSLYLPPLHGTGLQKVGHGTLSTAEIPGSIARRLITSAWSAAMGISRGLRSRMSAAWPVTRGDDAKAESMTLIELARSAEQPTVETGTRAPITAQSRVLLVQQIGVDMPVYNLTVAHDHEYFANGVLVSNCDAALYIHRESYHHRYRPPAEKVVTGTPQWVTREETEMFDAAQETYGR